MGSEVFKACTALEKITFPSRNIANGTGSNIFAECSSLKNATIPSAVTKLSDELFDGVSENFAIYGYTGSYAESYAKDHSFKFVRLSLVGSEMCIRDSSEPFRYLSIKDIISWDGIPEQEKAARRSIPSLYYFCPRI